MLVSSHYKTKPFDPVTVETAVRVALREARVESIESEPGEDYNGAGSELGVIGTNAYGLDEKLGGGIPLRSLAFVEGASSAGKSVLCQHFTYNALQDGRAAAYFTSENTPKSLVTQMGSVGLDVATFFQQRKLRIYSLEEFNRDPAPLRCDHPGVSMEFATSGDEQFSKLARVIHALPNEYQLVVVDSLTDLAMRSQEEAITGFFASCKRLCDAGRIVILVIHSNVLDEKILVRLRSLCNVYLSLRVERIGAKLSKLLEVHKVYGAGLATGRVVSFEVMPGQGIQVTAVKQFRA